MINIEIDNTPKMRDINQYLKNIQYLFLLYGKEKALNMIQDLEKEMEKDLESFNKKEK